MRISEKILEDWGDISEQQIALAKDVLIEELERLLNLKSVACLSLHIECKLNQLRKDD
tara:strand:+ start:1049 stop:1222 length:174 start_codon:yes stop_codon:yes gene_type:complete